ncbi:ABC transporter ATP-binding protein [Isobaculum melis]|nr:ABC transporter ATP-binding protein [Isobaculum melis]
MKIELKQVSKSYQQKEAVKHFSLSIAPNDCIGLIGPNGAGKTSLIKMIVGVLEPTSGTILIDGEVIEKRKDTIGYLPQTPQFFSWMTAEETLSFMGQLSHMTPAELVREIPLVLEKVGLKGEEKTKIENFSGGMKQRLGIAQAILHHPKFLVMDEPVSALDPIGRREVLDILTEIKKETAIIFSTHILSDANEICERFCFMKQGEKILDQTVDEMLENEASDQLVITYKGAIDLFLKELKKEQAVKNIVVRGHQLMLTVENLEQNKIPILQQLIACQVDLLSYSIQREDLEEIFFKKVGVSLANNGAF